MVNTIFKTNKESVVLHGHHIYQASYDMNMAAMCAYLPSQHSLAHWKRVLCYCDNYPHIDLPRQELYKQHSNTCPTISFNVYRIIAQCSVPGILALDESKFCRLCLHDPASVTPVIIYTRKELVMM